MGDVWEDRERGGGKLEKDRKLCNIMQYFGIAIKGKGNGKFKAPCPPPPPHQTMAKQILPCPTKSQLHVWSHKMFTDVYNPSDYHFADK